HTRVPVTAGGGQVGYGFSRSGPKPRQGTGGKATQVIRLAVLHEVDEYWDQKVRRRSDRTESLDRFTPYREIRVILDKLDEPRAGRLGRVSKVLQGPKGEFSVGRGEHLDQGSNNFRIVRRRSQSLQCLSRDEPDMPVTVSQGVGQRLSRRRRPLALSVKN